MKGKRHRNNVVTEGAQVCVVINIININIITNTGTKQQLVERSDWIVQWLLQNQHPQEFIFTGI
jgi:hypothetical protein